MLSAKERDALKQVGPGTALGQLFRRFWLPVLPAGDLADPGGAPVELRVLNERLVAFRDSAGRLGVIDAHCPHEGASLKWGVNDAGGLMCILHGWKFDVEGNRMDSGAVHMRKVQIKAYAVSEARDRVWLYMGPVEACPAPLAPEIVSSP